MSIYFGRPSVSQVGMRNSRPRNRHDKARYQERVSEPTGPPIDLGHTNGRVSGVIQADQVLTDAESRVPW